jgi:nucleoside-diphosphate-sugar epimerase
MDALIGRTGFVGGTLLRQRSFDDGFASADNARIRGRDFDQLVCAGAPAAKWIAEREPEADLANIRNLAGHLDEVSAKQFILVSTVDIFADSAGADEDDDPDEARLTAYGANRLWLERFVRDRFPRALVVRLPGLVGPGLRKNAVFDLLNGNNLHLIDARAAYQFYPMVNLWNDLQTALNAGLDLLHLTAAPVTIGEVAREGFGIAFDGRVEGREPARYDLQTRHAALFGNAGRYTCARRESLTAIRAYAQSEPRSKPIA